MDFDELDRLVDRVATRFGELADRGPVALLSKVAGKAAGCLVPIGMVVAAIALLWMLITLSTVESWTDATRLLGLAAVLGVPVVVGLRRGWRRGSNESRVFQRDSFWITVTMVVASVWTVLLLGMLAFSPMSVDPCTTDACVSGVSSVLGWWFLSLGGILVIAVAAALVFKRFWVGAVTWFVMSFASLLIMGYFVERVWARWD